MVNAEPAFMTDSPSSRPMSRRGVLRAGAGAGAAVLGASALLIPTSSASAHGSLISRADINGIPLYYQDLNTGNVSPTSFLFDPTVYSMLGTWLNFYYLNTPVPYRWPGAIYCNGTHVDKGGMHQYGRAMDISAIMMTHLSWGWFDAFNARWDQWGSGPHAAEYQRRYWATVAGMSMHFRHTLHWADPDTEHNNHAHVDNAVSGGGLSNFTTSSTTQVRMVQAVCRYIFGLGTSVDGSFGSQTDSHSRAVIAASGWGGGIRDSQQNWHRFCWAGQRAGHGMPIT